MGIEPTSKAWEAFVLPLNYTRVLRYSGILHDFQVAHQQKQHCKMPLKAKSQHRPPYC